MALWSRPAPKFQLWFCMHSNTRTLVALARQLPVRILNHLRLYSKLVLPILCPRHAISLAASHSRTPVFYRNSRTVVPNRVHHLRAISHVVGIPTLRCSLHESSVLERYITCMGPLRLLFLVLHSSNTYPQITKAFNYQFRESEH